jgi:hypothetical protein
MIEPSGGNLSQLTGAARSLKLEEALIKGLPPFGTALVTGSAPPIPTQSDPPPASRTGVPEPCVPKPRPRVTVAQALDAYLADAVSRSVESSTLKKLETIFRKQFLAWTRVQGLRTGALKFPERARPILWLRHSLAEVQVSMPAIV